MPANQTLLEQLPQPVAVRERMGQLYRELALLRRLLRLSQAARDAFTNGRSNDQEEIQCCN